MDRLRRSLAASVVLMLGSVLLAACGAGGSSSDTLFWYINPDAGGQAKVAKNCSTSAYKIEVQVLPQNASEQRIQLARRLAAEDPDIDIMSIDPPYTAEFANAGFLAAIPRGPAGLPEAAVLQGRGGCRHLGRQAGGRAVLVQHPGALVPQVLRPEGRARHEPAGHLGPDHRRRREERREGRRTGEQVRGLLGVDQRTHLRRRRRDRHQHRRRASTSPSRSTHRRVRRRRRSSRSWRAPPPRRPTFRSPTRAPRAARSAVPRARSWSTGPTSGRTTTRPSPR